MLTRTREFFKAGVCTWLTVYDPPIPCGTVMQCSYPCLRPALPCSHPTTRLPLLVLSWLPNYVLAKRSWYLVMFVVCLKRARCLVGWKVCSAFLVSDPGFFRLICVFHRQRFYMYHNDE
jgi:hypothetical protein